MGTWCSEKLSDYVILAQVNSTPEDESEDKNLARQNVPAAEADEHLRALQKFCEEQEGMQSDASASPREVGKEANTICSH